MALIKIRTEGQNNMTRVHTRRSLLVRGAGLIMVASIIASGCGRPSGEPAGASGSTAFPVALDFLKNVENAGMWIADDAGYYRDEGLAVEFKEGGPNAPAPETSLISGEAKIAFETNLTRLFNTLAKGQDLVIVGAQYQHTPVGLVSLAKHPVRGPEDLNGLRVLAAERNRPSVESLMRRNKVTDYEFVPAGAGVDALTAGQGEAMLAFRNNQPVTLEQKFKLTEDKDFFFATMDELGMPAYAKLILVDRDYLKDNRAAVVGFLRATARGWEDNIRDPQSGTKLTVKKYGKHLGLNPEEQQRANELQLPLLQSELTKKNGLLTVDVDRLAGPVYDGLRAAGMKKLPDPNDIVDKTVLEDALKGK